jgi:hypothetical protein
MSHLMTYGSAMQQQGDGRRFIVSVVCTLVLGLGAMTSVALATHSEPEPVVRLQQAAPAAIIAAPAAAPVVRKTPAALPFGEGPIFPGHRLVAYYGTAGTGALGVLGEDTPDRITRRLRKAAAPFATPKRPVQIVYELIVTIADAHPGPDGDFSHDIAREKVARYIRAAHRNKALLVLDLQPGRSDFLKVAKRWAWALRDPWVGLALDPEWRMGPRQVPAQVIGSVRAREVNAVSLWLQRLSQRNDLPQKVFMLHSFRTSMISGIENVVRRPRLATVLHVDGFGTPSQKLATYHAVAGTRPQHMRMGFKLFYDEDVNRMNAEQVNRIRPVVDFISFQ